MNRQEVENLAGAGGFQGRALNGELQETHSAWIILSGRNAFKIKKPVKFSFLDYSTPALRKEACHRELSLNGRFSDIYLAVVPVCFDCGRWELDGKGPAMDYAVWMKRMAFHKQMDRMLEHRAVEQRSIRALARTVSSFHNLAEVVRDPFELGSAKETFRDLLSVELFLGDNLESRYHKIPARSVEWHTAFLNSHAGRLLERIDEGFKRDVHGDLHSGNIFLYSKPVLFDCVEFNDCFRQIDILDEVSFLCMDLEMFGEQQLAACFLAEYTRYIPLMPKEEDKLVFNYFKCLSANIRAKVHALSAQQAADSGIRNNHLQRVRKYLSLMDRYVRYGSS